MSFSDWQNLKNDTTDKILYKCDGNAKKKLDEEDLEWSRPISSTYFWANSVTNMLEFCYKISTLKVNRV